MAPRSVLALVFVLALAPACGREPSRAEVLVERALEASGTPVARPLPPPAGEKIVTVETEDGLYTATSGEDLPLPAGFPGDVALPADGRVQVSTTLGEAMSVTLHSPRSPEPVFEEFRAAQRAAGWREAEVSERSPVQALGLSKNGRLLQATFATEPDGGTAVSLSVQPAGS